MSAATIRYFEMRDDVHVPQRWYLADPVDRHEKKLSGVFSRGEPAKVDPPVRVPFSKFAERGTPVDYSELSAETVPVVHLRVAEALTELAPSDVQLIPVEIEGQPDQFCIVNVTRTIKCIDDAASRYVRRYTEADVKLFADRIGKYKDVRGMRIDPALVGEAKIFRPWSWRVSIIVAEQIRHALEQIATRGVRFEEV